LIYADNMRRYIIVAILMVVFLLPSAVAFGQEPTTEPTATPTITPTPAWQSVVTLSSGNELLIERRITYGEIALVCAMGAMGVMFLCYIAIRAPKLWI